jgi:hypothetical protein
MINDVAREGGAQGCADSHCAPDNPQSKVEAAGAPRNVSNDEWNGDPQNRG